MVLTRSAERLMIYLGQSEHHTGTTPTYVEIVERARKAKLAGATVLGGVEGFGAANQMHRRHAMSVSEDVPVVVIVVDSSSKIESFLSGLDDMRLDAMVVRQPVEVVAHRSRKEHRS